VECDPDVSGVPYGTCDCTKKVCIKNKGGDGRHRVVPAPMGEM
jgi:hypothetical protein